MVSPSVAAYFGAWLAVVELDGEGKGDLGGPEFSRAWAALCPSRGW